MSGFLKIPKRKQPPKLPKGLKPAPASPRKPMDTIYHDRDDDTKMEK